MVIQCPHCQARFKLALDKLKPGGTKVRCTKCKIVFMVTPPQEDASSGALQDDHLAQGAGEAEEAAEKVAPGEDYGTGFDAAEFFSDGDEGDEFLFAQATAEEDGPDLFAADDSNFDQQDELSWDEDAFDPFAVPEPDGGLEEAVDPFAMPETDEEDDGGLPSTEELFSPPVEESSEPEPSTVEESTGTSLTLAVEDEAESGAAAVGFSDEVSDFDEPLSRMPLPAPRPPAERRKKSSWGRVWLLLLLLLLAGGGYAYHARHQLNVFLQKALVDWQLIPVPPPEAGGLKPVKLAGYFVANRREGRLFVIQGQVLNEGAEARAAIVVQGTVYDRTGVQVAQQSAFCGNPMGKEQLRAWPMLRMSERMQNQFGEMLANLNLEPKKAIPFTLVFKDLSGEVAEFEVAVAASEPVIK